MRIVRLLWDSTETYRALYYNDPADRDDSLAAHERIVAAMRDLDADRLSPSSTPTATRPSSASPSSSPVDGPKTRQIVRFSAHQHRAAQRKALRPVIVSPITRAWTSAVPS